MVSTVVLRCVADRCGAAYHGAQTGKCKVSEWLSVYRPVVSGRSLAAGDFEEDLVPLGLLNQSQGRMMELQQMSAEGE